VEDVGSAFKHERVFYHRGTIEACGYPAGYFDLVFARATMEHVADLRAGFSEMARVTKPGGTIWSNASPLWHSPYGHHMECFQGHPWIHLVFDQGAIISYARAHGIDGERGHSLEAIVDYMLDRRFFNMLPARAYIDAVRALQGVSLVRNELVRLDAELLNQPLAGRALEIGLDRDELLSVTHQMIARKI
jgi:SAM-dependent methyltransferase